MQGKESGIFFYNILNSEFEKVITKNDTLLNSTGYGSPNKINDSTLICSSYYRIVKIDLSQQKEELIIPSTGYQYDEVRYNRTQNKIYFRKTDYTDKIYVMDLLNKDIKEIIIKDNGIQ